MTSPLMSIQASSQGQEPSDTSTQPGDALGASPSRNARWRYSYLQATEGEGKPMQSTPAREDFKFIAVLSIAERKKLANLKQGDWTRLTAGPFVDLPVCLKEIEYKDGNASVAATFLEAQRG